MKTEFERWSKEYPTAYITAEGFEASKTAKLVTNEIPAAIKKAVPTKLLGFDVQGSAGQSKWTHTPWVAILNPAITQTVQEEFYVVYLLRPDGTRIYLSINQGCTKLKDSVGLDEARKELVRRAAVMRNRVTTKMKRFTSEPFELGSKLWRAQLYSKGDVLHVEYDTAKLPSDEQLVQDLEEALRLYRELSRAGGSASEDEMLRDAEEAGAGATLKEAKRYRLHRSIERQAGNSKKVKDAQGTTCKGCDRNLRDVYGKTADGLIHAHHLKPLSKLEADEEVELDPIKDFAVLCPNCHAVIHRFKDVSDIEHLRSLICR